MPTIKRAGTPPLPPPQQGPRPINAALAPQKPEPGRHRLEAVAVQRQAPMAANTNMDIHKPSLQDGPFAITGPLDLGHAFQGERLGLAVMKDRTVRVMVETSP